MDKAQGHCDDSDVDSDGGPAEKGSERMATQEEKQAYIDDMARRRGYVLAYHKGMAAADFDVLKAADGRT